MRCKTLTWASLLIFLYLGGCAALPPAPAPKPAAPLSAADIVDQMQSRSQKLESFQAKGRLTYLSPERNYAGTALLAGKWPATLKADVLDPLGRTALSFATDGVQVQVLSPREGKLYSGPATPKNMAPLIPPGVTVQQGLGLLVGALPLSQGAPQRFEYEPAQDRYRLEWVRGDGGVQERLWVSAQGVYPVREEWYGPEADPRFTADFSGFGVIAPDTPEKVTIKTAVPAKELRLVYSQMRLNAPVSTADLTLTPPAGVVAVPLAP